MMCIVIRRTVGRRYATLKNAHCIFMHVYQRDK